MKLTKQDVIGKYIPIESEEHFYYVYDLLVEMGCSDSCSMRSYLTGSLPTEVIEIRDHISHMIRLPHADEVPVDRVKLEIPLPISQQSLPTRWKLSCGDKPEVRAWLKELGYVWAMGQDIVECGTDQGLLIGDSYNMTVSYALSSFIYESEDVMEIFHTFSEREITVTELFVSGFKLSEQKNEKELQLESLVDKLKAQLNEAQSELNKIKDK